MSSLTLRQHFSNLLHRDSTVSSTVFNASDSVSVSMPTTPGGTNRSWAAGDVDQAAATALMTPDDRQSAPVQRSVSAARRPPRHHRHPPPLDASSDIIEMQNLR